MSRKLTDTEKKQVEAYARKTADPARGRVINVTVDDTLDDDGKVHFTTLYAEETILPKNWKPE